MVSAVVCRLVLPILSYLVVVGLSHYLLSSFLPSHGLLQVSPSVYSQQCLGMSRVLLLLLGCHGVRCGVREPMPLSARPCSPQSLLLIFDYLFFLFVLFVFRFLADLLLLVVSGNLRSQSTFHAARSPAISTSSLKLLCLGASINKLSYSSRSYCAFAANFTSRSSCIRRMCPSQM